MEDQKLIPPHGGYRKLKSYQAAEIVYDFTAEFCRAYVAPDGTNGTGRSYRMAEQMVQAARSGKQNIAEGSMDSGTSKKIELKLVNIARGSLEELLLDYEDFLRQRGLELWGKNDPRAGEIRGLAYAVNRSYGTYKAYIAAPEAAANCAICLINQTNFLLDKQLQSLEKEFLEQGGFTERLYWERKKARGRQEGVAQAKTSFNKSNRTYKSYK